MVTGRRASQRGAQQMGRSRAMRVLPLPRPEVRGVGLQEKR
jgi:hypothetical protein